MKRYVNAWMGFWVMAGLIVLNTACGGGKTETPQTPVSITRSEALGFTYTPYDNTGTALEYAFHVIATDGDLLVSHHDDGVPWDAALANDYSAYPVDLRSEIEVVNTLKPAGHRLYLAVTPIAFLRDRLAPTRLDGGTQAFQSPWDTRDFDDPNVVTAFTNHCRLMIDHLHPDWFTFGIEVNLLRAKASDAVFQKYLALAHAVRSALKTTYPSLPLIQTIQAETFYADRTTQEIAVRAVLPDTDLIAISSYPFADAVRYPEGSQSNPSLLPADYFSAFWNLDPSKPFAIAETGWPAEDVTVPYPVTTHSSTGYQKSYVEFLLKQTEQCNGRFVNWYVSRDYDAYWDHLLKNDPNAYLLRLWKDNGLYDGDGNPRPSLASWRATLALPRR